MSRIGKQEIAIPDGVEVKVEDLAKGGQKVTVKKDKNELSREFRPEVKVTVEEKQVVVTRVNDGRVARSLHGLTRTLINNMVIGVTKGYETRLEIVGVGYRAAIKGTNLDLQLGKSHPIVIEPPTGISFKVEANTKIIVSGPDKEVVGQVCANIMAERPPEPYKGKGIRFEGQHIKLKAGKSGAK